MKNVSNEAKVLISKILLPDGKRISCKDIFKDHWVLRQAPKHPIKVNFSRMLNFSKFSKVFSHNIQIKKLAATYIATKLS